MYRRNYRKIVKYTIRDCKKYNKILIISTINLELVPYSYKNSENDYTHFFQFLHPKIPRISLTDGQFKGMKKLSQLFDVKF